MKFCITARQEAEYLAKADEIKFEYRDRRGIPDFVKKYPDKTFILEIPRGVEVDVAEIKESFYLSNQKLIICLPDITIPEVDELRKLEIPFYWGYAITTPYDLKSAADLGVSYIRVGAPLFFDIDVIASYGIPVRCMVNLANDGFFPNRNGIIGPWIRPEDLNMYGSIIESVDFAFEELSQERALYRIYAERKEWPGNLDMIVKNVDDKAINRMLPTEFTINRLHCKQRCMNNGITRNCHLCETYIKLANPDFVKSAITHKEN